MSKASYPPSEQKLLELRRRGQTPYSSLLTRAAVLMTLVTLIFSLMDDFLSVVWFSSSALVTEQLLSEHLQEKSFSLLRLLLLVTGLSAGAGFLVGFIQTRFLISFSRKAARPKDDLHPRAFRRGLAGIFGSLALIVIWLSITGFLLLSLRDYLPFSSSPAADLKSMLRSEGLHFIAVLSDLTILVLLGMFFLAVIDRTLVWIRFRNEHGMSREELEAEYRESESSPEVREQMKAAMNPDS